MAIAKKCDICSELYETYNDKNDPDNVNGIMFLNIDDKGRYFSNDAMDCCPACMVKLKTFIVKLRNSQVL